MTTFHIHIHLPTVGEPLQAIFGRAPDGDPPRTAYDDMVIGPQEFIPHPSAEPMAGAKGFFPRPLRDRLRARLTEEALLAAGPGASHAQVAAILDELESDRPLIDWLLNGGWEKILALILQLLKFAV